jgi:putative membrane protein insertion efficiency factor
MRSRGTIGRDSSGCDGGAGRSLPQGLLLLGVEAYRVTLSPLLGGHCRYEPSCSRYAEEAIERHGAAAGMRLALGRLLRCHPFRPGGFDPVP